jgi:ATP-dependent exoDNAse (exonuclease V) alpha subunit
MREWYHKGQLVTRTMLPLMLAWAITMHRAQGIEAPKAIIDIGNREFSGGLTYTAFSRPKSFATLAFDPVPNYDRIVSIFRSKFFKERRQEEDRKAQLERETLDWYNRQSIQQK